jgi:hypothetical protein
MRHRGTARLLLLSCALGMAVAGGAVAAGFRNIASVTANAYFNGDWRVETTNVLLARVGPALTAEARITRVDSEGFYQHTFFLGPVVSFTDALYAEAVYGLGIDSEGLFTHELNANFNYETSTSAASVGLKVNWFPDSGYYYFLPSVSGRFHPLPPLGLFGKFFLSVDSDSVLTESFWGEADYQLSTLVRARAGFTMSMASAFGYTLIAGLDLSFSPAVILRYCFQFLSDTIEYLDSPQPRSGIANILTLDLRF